MSFSYRPEIDGLRAIAVLAVILYHAEFALGGMPLLSGGFVGVDIFLVISGYLITSIILREMQQGSFSFLRFYERRARRILPALFLVMAASLPFALLLMEPQARREYSGSGLASLGFVSNIWFWLEDSYTAGPSALKPLLHTWSLSVEEQFYLLFPPVLLLARLLFRRRLLPAFMLALLLSLGLSHYGSASFANAAFFLLPTRAWELLAGGVMAVLETQRSRDTAPALRSVLMLAGLLLIAVSFVLFNDNMRHPSLITLLPVSGAMLLIWCGHRDDRVTRLLSGKAFVAIGLCSYSLYLWHFPVFAFARIAGIPEGNAAKLLLIGLATILALLAYHTIEKPLRNRALVSARTLALALMGAALLLATAFALLHRQSVQDLQSFRLAGRLFNIDAENDKRYARAYAACGTWEPAQCSRPREGKVNILVVGDSMSVDAVNMLGTLYPDYYFAFSSLGGCPPSPDIAALVDADHPDLQQCIELNAARFDAGALEGFDGVVIDAQMGWFRPGHLEPYLEFLSAHGMRNVLVMGNYIQLTRNFTDIIRDNASLPFSYTELQTTPYIGNEFIFEEESRQLAARYGAGFLSVKDHACGNGDCTLFVEGYPYTWDSLHFSVEFADFLAGKIQPATELSWLNRLSEE